MTTVNLQIDSADPAWATGLAASLPVSVNRTGASANLILVDGGADWPDRLCGWMTKGHRSFVIIDPQVPSNAALCDAIAAIQTTNSQIVISETYADNPAVAPFISVLEGSWSAVTITGTGTLGPTDIALQQLRLARRIGLDGFKIVNTLAMRDSALATIEATFGDTAILLRMTLARTRAVSPHHRLMAHSPIQTACIEISGEPDARPARAFRATQEHGLDLPMLYENAHRAALRGFADGTVRCDDLAVWAADAALAVKITA